MKDKTPKHIRDAQALYDALQRYGLEAGAPPRERVHGIRSVPELLLVCDPQHAGSDGTPKLPPPQPPAEPPAEPPRKTATVRKPKTGAGFAGALAELDAMIGLAPVKAQVRAKAAQVRNIRERERHGLPVPVTSHHMVFTGNPGTGKTTVARLVARIFKELGMLSRGHMVEVDRADLVAKYVGHTEDKVRSVIAGARGGVLFVDEAYALAKNDSSNDYGQDAINIILKSMEDERDRLVMIFAGYGEEMQTFLESNPGLRSRCKTIIDFPDYTPLELMAIFVKLCGEYSFTMTDEAAGRAFSLFAELHLCRGKGFGNGRAARSAFELAWERQALRLAGKKSVSEEALRTLEAADIPGAGDLTSA